ncbi:MAG TPA: hypothetical protein GXX58_03945 [Gelria sp.]|nr:hypothetical protein [Gelria sp.]
MMFFSLLLNTLLFFVVLNISYLRQKRRDPDYPDKPFSKLVLFPLALGIVFTLIVDVFKIFFIYQMVLFGLAALFLYWVFYFFNRKSS